MWQVVKKKQNSGLVTFKSVTEKSVRIRTIPEASLAEIYVQLWRNT